MKTINRIVAILSLIGMAVAVNAQQRLTLEQCRALALENNNQLKIAQEEINKAGYDKKSAFANYLPKVSVSGVYAYNSIDEMHLLSDEQDMSLRNLGTTVGTQVGGSLQQMQQNAVGTVQQIMANPAADPALAQLIGNSPTIQQLLQVIQTTDVSASLAPTVATLNGIGSEIADNLILDTKNVFAGIVSVQEPIFMGGKIVTYNKIAAAKKELEETKYSSEEQETTIETDKLYWQIVSLTNKLKLTEKYVELLQTMSENVDKMADEGVATASDKLSVKVKLNQAETTLLKVQNGLALSKMLLCQHCGMDINTDISLADETLEDVVVSELQIQYTENDIMENRPELRSLHLATELYKQNVNLTRSDYLPTVAAFGNYVLSNPSCSDNGFQNEFSGFWNVGVVARIPILQWGEGVNKIRKAKADEKIAQYKLDDAKEKIMLQVNQYERQIEEAKSRVKMAEEKMSDAEENLRMATLGFEEGVIPSSGLTEAQTAWLQAHSEYIDSKIDWIMAKVYLQKATGILNK
ncbi:MAG: TolC family protein [Bacteroidales bacterium]|nr:TolC family protein [Bacteroidales bacterium]